MRQRRLLDQTIARAMLAAHAVRAERYLIVSGKAARISDCFALMVALATYMYASVECNGIESWVEKAEYIDISEKEMLLLCTFLAECHEYQPSPQWPHSKQQMQDALKGAK